jgi:hypothetical protein
LPPAISVGCGTGRSKVCPGNLACPSSKSSRNDFDDASRIRNGHARNVSLLRHLSHNLLKNDQTARDSMIADKRKRACLSSATLERFLKLGDSK